MKNGIFLQNIGDFELMNNFNLPKSRFQLFSWVHPESDIGDPYGHFDAILALPLCT